MLRPFGNVAQDHRQRLRNDLIELIIYIRVDLLRQIGITRIADQFDRL